MKFKDLMIGMSAYVKYEGEYVPVLIDNGAMLHNGVFQITTLINNVRFSVPLLQVRTVAEHEAQLISEYLSNEAGANVRKGYQVTVALNVPTPTGEVLTHTVDVTYDGEFWLVQDED
jgi:hypothetical protein